MSSSLHLIINFAFYHDPDLIHKKNYPQEQFNVMHWSLPSARQKQWNGIHLQDFVNIFQGTYYLDHPIVVHFFIFQLFEERKLLLFQTCKMLQKCSTTAGRNMLLHDI